LLSRISHKIGLACAVLALASCSFKQESPSDTSTGVLSGSSGVVGSAGKAPLNKNGTKKTAFVPAREKIVFGIPWEPVSFNPLRALDSGSYYAQTLVYEGLIKYDPNLQLVPGLAESFEVSEDGKTYSFKLRKDLKFSDDTPILLDDVEASIKSASSPSSPFKTDYKCIKNLERKDSENTLVMHLDSPSAPLLARLAELRILPAKILNKPDHGAADLSRTPLSSGPFQLSSWESGLELVFVPNPNYWGEKPKFKQLVWRVVPDKTLLEIALRRGELDVASVDPLNCSATFSSHQPAAFGRSNSEPSGARDTGVEVDQFNGTRTVYLGFNVHRPPFNKIKLRQAVCTSINRAELAKVLFAGYASVARSDVSPGAYYYNPAVKQWPFNQRLSFDLLRQAGYDYTNRGWYQHETDLQPSGVTAKSSQFAFRILTVKDFQDVAQGISDDLSQVGVPTEVQVLEYTTLRSKYLKSSDFDVFLWSRSSGTDPDCSLVWGTGGPLNFVNYSDPTVDKLIQEGRKTTNRQKRIAIYGSIQQILAEQLPWVFLVQPKLLVAHKPDIDNVKQANQEKTGLPWDNPLFNAPRWERRNRR
jgi:peptide/nickel transport system substrate-binding protein